MTAVIGIDLGTTFSAVATLDETGRPVIVHNNDGKNITPSCVTEEDGVVEVGEYARRTWCHAPNRAAARFKRKMGTSEEYVINRQRFTPTELSTLVLKKMLKDAGNTLGDIGEAVVTIPANFSNEAREATMAAAKAAGLDIKFIINEPTAAALYYAFKNGDTFHGTYAVYDLGGGTFDISIIKVDGHNVDVIASNGVHKLGGDDFDRIILELVSKKYKEQTGFELQSGDFTMNDAEEEKKSLSKRKRVTVQVGRKLIEISREEFNEAISNFINQTEMVCEATLDEAGIEPSEVKSVLLAGGSTRIPLVRESILKVFKQKPVSSVNVDEVVALGAALYAAYRGDPSQLSIVQKRAIQKIKVQESTNKYYGTLILNANATKESELQINSIIIKKGEKIPCSVQESFFTVYDGQDAVNCRLTESASPETDPQFVTIVWNGKLELPDGRPEGQEIKVTYAYDANQMIHCSFVDVASGRKKEISLSTTDAKKLNTNKIEKFLVD